MKSLTEHIWFEVPARRGFINVTPKIEEFVSQSGVREGLCLVNAMHIATPTTAIISAFQLSAFQPLNPLFLAAARSARW